LERFAISDASETRGVFLDHQDTLLSNVNPFNVERFSHSIAANMSEAG
jgi:hypothetical protein